MTTETKEDILLKRFEEYKRERATLDKYFENEIKKLERKKWKIQK